MTEESDDSAPRVQYCGESRMVLTWKGQTLVVVEDDGDVFVAIGCIAEQVVSHNGMAVALRQYFTWAHQLRHLISMGFYGPSSPEVAWATRTLNDEA